jgi:hypothetical protein
MGCRNWGALTNAVPLLLSLGSIVSGQQLPIRAYTAIDGLPHNTINAIVRDSHGFLWVYNDLTKLSGGGLSPASPQAEERSKTCPRSDS